MERDFRSFTEILAKLAPVSERLVLVGGQALNFWAERYAPRVPELRAEAPYTSDDADFLGGSREVIATAQLLDGTPYVATSDDHNTTNTGRVVFAEDGEEKEGIDFLSDPPFGLKGGEVEKYALPFDVSGVVLRIMHPFHCMQSRAKNVHGLSGYRTPHAIKQLRASVFCAREFFRELLVERGEVKAVRKWFQRAWVFAMRDPAAVFVFETYGVDTFGATFADDRLGNGFSEGSYARMIASLVERREKNASGRAPRDPSSAI